MKPVFFVIGCIFLGVQIHNFALIVLPKEIISKIAQYGNSPAEKSHLYYSLSLVSKKCRVGLTKYYSSYLLVKLYRSIITDCRYSRAPMHWAAMHNHYWMLKQILTLKKYKVNDCLTIRLGGFSFLGYFVKKYPLHLAVKYGAFESIEVLLSAQDINVNQTTDYGLTPFYFLLQPSHQLQKKFSKPHYEKFIKVVRLFLNHPSFIVRGYNYLIDSPRCIIDLILGHPKVDVNEKNSRGHTPLYCALKNEDFPKVLSLLLHPDIHIKPYSVDGHSVSNTKNNKLKTLTRDASICNIMRLKIEGKDILACFVPSSELEKYWIKYFTQNRLSL